jgi:hypothetical protein
MATLTTAEFFSHTNDDNKDKDTGVFVEVKTKNGNTLLAEINDADNSTRDETEYNDGSEHVIPLVVKSTGSTKEECAAFKVRVRSKANGNDKWKFNARLTLGFSDGTNLVKSKDDIELNSRGSQFAEDNF